MDVSVADFADFRPQQTRNGFQRARFARPIGTQQSDNLAFVHAQGNASEHENNVMVNDLDIVHPEHCKSASQVLALITVLNGS
jgi:hypothetical protein